MIKSCELQTKISPSYFRNNRSTRQKSLRCFPACCLKGHVAGGFCGQALRATMTLTAEDKPISIGDYLFIAEIRPLSTPRLSSQGTIKKHDLMEQIRVKNDKNSLNRELFMGEINVVTTTTKEVTFDIIFNSHLSSWDYSWKSNRWSGPNERHVIDIIVLKCVSIADLLVNSFYTSSSFVIVSSHNKSTIPKEFGGTGGSQNSDMGQGSDDEEGYNMHMQRSNSFSYMIPVPASIHKTNSLPAYPDEAHSLQHSSFPPDLTLLYHNAGMTQLNPTTNISLPGSGKKSALNRKPSISESMKHMTTSSSSSSNHKKQPPTATQTTTNAEIEEDVLQASTLLRILATESVKRSNDFSIPTLLSSTTSSSKSANELLDMTTAAGPENRHQPQYYHHKRKKREDEEESDSSEQPGGVRSSSGGSSSSTESDDEEDDEEAEENISFHTKESIYATAGAGVSTTSFLQRKKRSKSAPVVSISTATVPLQIASDTTNTNTNTTPSSSSSSGSSASSTTVQQSQQEHRENAMLLLSLLVRPNQYQYDKNHQPPVTQPLTQQTLTQPLSPPPPVITIPSPGIRQETVIVIDIAHSPPSSTSSTQMSRMTIQADSAPPNEVESPSTTDLHHVSTIGNGYPTTSYPMNSFPAPSTSSASSSLCSNNNNNHNNIMNSHMATTNTTTATATVSGMNLTPTMSHTHTSVTGSSNSNSSSSNSSSNRLLANNPSMLTYQEYLAFMNHQSANGLMMDSSSAMNTFSLPPNVVAGGNTSSNSSSSHNNIHDLVFLPPRKPAFSMP